MLRGFPVALSVKVTVMTMMTLILIYPHAKGYPNGIVITVTEKTVLLVLVDVWINIPPKSVGFGDSYMPQRLVCFVVRMVKNNDQTQKSIQGKPKKIVSGKDVAIWHPFANGERTATSSWSPAGMTTRATG